MPGAGLETPTYVLARLNGVTLFCKEGWKTLCRVGCDANPSKTGVLQFRKWLYRRSESPAPVGNWGNGGNRMRLWRASLLPLQAACGLRAKGPEILRGT